MRTRRLDWDGSNPGALARELREAEARDPRLADAVETLIDQVRQRGDAALLELTERFDGVRPDRLRVPESEIQGAPGVIPEEVRSALRVAATNIRLVAEAQVSDTPAVVELPQGQTVTVREVAMGSAGIYVPGGRAALASTALMCAIPAQVAGVERIAVVSPPGPDGCVSATVLAACAEAGVEEVYAVGGAQAIAALALGTETIEAVDIVAGPGNPYTQEAKRRLFGTVGVDGLAGPSELMVVLGETVDVEAVALDLCAQAEHGEDSPLVAVAVESRLLDELAERVDALAAERPSVCDATLALVEAPDTDAAMALANAYAPEHLELMTEDAELLAPGARTAGCVFIGEGGATAFGDYAAGSNHVLPTAGAGRFSGPLGPGTFRRRIANVSLPRSAAAALAPDVEALAQAEGLPVHGESATARGSQR